MPAEGGEAQEAFKEQKTHHLVPDLPGKTANSQGSKVAFCTQGDLTLGPGAPSVRVPGIEGT